MSRKAFVYTNTDISMKKHEKKVKLQIQFSYSSGRFNDLSFSKKKKDSSTCVRTRNTEHKKGIRHEKKFFWMHIGGWTEKHSSPIDCPSPCFSICYLLVPPSLCFYFWLTSDQLNCLIYCSCAPVHQVTIGQCVVMLYIAVWYEQLAYWNAGPMHFLEVATALWVGHTITSEFRFCNYFAHIWILNLWCVCLIC